MRHYTVPGVYIESAPKKIEPIKIFKRCLVGFIGLAEMGPLHEPVKITHFQEFLDIFGGFTDYAYLAHAIFGFFNCGGKECIVVRTAHQGKSPEKSDTPIQPLLEFDTIESKDAAIPDKNAACKAFLVVKNTKGIDSLKINAGTEGMWGDKIRIKLWYASEVTTRVITQVPVGSNTIEVQSTEDMIPGDCICIYGKDKKEYKRIAGIKGNTIQTATPFEQDYKVESHHSLLQSELNEVEHGQIYCEKILINLLVLYEKSSEEYLYCSLNPKDSDYFINNVNNQSQLIEIEELNNKGKEGIIPGEVYFVNLNYGRNGILGLTPADFIGYFKGHKSYKGIGVFEAFDDIAVIVCPDLLIFQELIYRQDERKEALNAIFAVQGAMIDQCEKLANRFAILDSPVLPDTIDLLKWRDRFDARYAALYYPRIEMINPEDPRGLSSILIPPSGHIAGSYADFDLKEGIFRAPANKFISGIVGVERIIDNEEYEIFYPKGINCMKYVPGRGVKVWGARTLSSNPAWRYINIRRTFNVIRHAIKNGAGWAVFEPNTAGLRKRLIRHISAFLLDLWRKGYMMGNIPEDGFYVKCDNELNPPEDVDKGIIRMEVGISIARPAEFLVVKLTANKEDSIVFIDE